MSFETRSARSVCRTEVHGEDVGVWAPGRPHTPSSQSAAAGRGAPRTQLLEVGYFFFSHLLAAACHIPPAFSHSAFVATFERSLELPDGLAAGELDEPPDDVVPPDFSEEVGALPGFPPPVPPVCAAAIAGARAMIPIKSVSISFCIVSSSCGGLVLSFPLDPYI
jgi:hypothetical protein